MAELILTDEEKAMPFWRDLDDANLGKVVKRDLLGMVEYRKENEARALSGLSAYLVLMTINEFGDECGIDVTGLEVKGKPVGDWEIIVRKVKRPWWKFWGRS